MLAPVVLYARDYRVHGAAPYNLSTWGGGREGKGKRASKREKESGRCGIKKKGEKGGEGRRVLHTPCGIPRTLTLSGHDLMRLLAHHTQGVDRSAVFYIRGLKGKIAIVSLLVLSSC